jgi:TatD DNase family protein
MSISPCIPADSKKFVWVDAHSHLQDPRLATPRPQVLDRARDAGVNILHVDATCETDWPAVQALADAHPDLICSFGIHPWFIEGLTEGWLPRLREQLSRRPAGIGEIGLDARMGDTLDPERESVFRAQLDLSVELELPASLHCRDAWPRMLEILLAMPPHPAGLLIHAYSGPVDALDALAEKNVFISFGGTLTRPNAKKVLEIAKQVKKGRFMVESDAPDLPPTLLEPEKAFLHDKNGKILSEPVYIPEIGRILAEIRGISVSDVAAETTETARQLFAKLMS